MHILHERRNLAQLSATRLAADETMPAPAGENIATTFTITITIDKSRCPSALRENVLEQLCDEFAKGALAGDVDLNVVEEIHRALRQSERT